MHTFTFRSVIFYLCFFISAGMLAPAYAQSPADYGVLPAGKTIEIRYRTVLDEDPPEDLEQVCEQDTIKGSNFAPVASDDPATAAAKDPTCTEVELDPYCQAGGSMSSSYISMVIAFNGQMSNVSGADPEGYGDYRDVFIHAPTGNQLYMYFAGMPSTAYKNWKVWIDWDLSETFEPYEVVASHSGNYGFYATIYLPYYVPAGEYRLRVGMSRFGQPVPCGENFFGEVEDYTLIKGGNITIGVPQATFESLKQAEFELFPNPSGGLFNSSITAPVDGEYAIRVYDMNGRQVWQQNESLQSGSHLIPVDGSAWAPGYYTVELQWSGGSLRERIIVH